MYFLKDSVLKKYRDPDRFIFILIFLLFIERIAMFFIIGPDTISNSDDVAYLEGGKYFAKTGILSVWLEMPTALIMPAMPIVTGIASLIFGEGTAYLVSLKILWIITGCITPYFFYKILSCFVPKWYAILGASVFLLPNFAWMDNIILTETPYLLFATMCLYFTFKMGQSADKKYLTGYIIAFILGISFRANTITLPIFTAVYLLIKRKYSKKELLRRLLVFVCASMIFFVPWTIRNYIRFDAFIPLSYGASDPTFKGTYQGVGSPNDDTLDYKSNVEDVLHEEYADYFDEDGNLKNQDQFQYIKAQGTAIAVKYRISEWIKNNPADFLKSYLLIKPVSMLNWVWYWGPASDTVEPILNIISKINMLLCAAAAVLSLIRKKERLPVFFLGGMYVINLYILAMSYAIERYAAMLMPLRYMIGIIGIYLIADFAKAAVLKHRSEIKA